MTSFAAPQTVHPRSIMKLMTRGSKFFGGGGFVLSIARRRACCSLYRFSGVSTGNDDEKWFLFFLNTCWYKMFLYANSSTYALVS